MFEAFKTEHGRSYTKEEELTRFEIFRNTLKVIDSRNSADGGAVHGITRFARLSEYLLSVEKWLMRMCMFFRFADLTQQEFEDMYLDRAVVSKIRGKSIKVRVICL